jgi:3'(2'),5'-bisphosphate nucleotidase
MYRLQPGQLDTLCAIAGAAGREVLKVYAEPFESWTKDDGSPVTAADVRADGVIRQALAAAFPGVFVVSEESVSQGPGAVETFFLVDPVDGTKEFLQRNGEFTVNVALVDRGEPVAGVVLAPALGQLYWAARGLGAWRRAWSPDPAAAATQATPLHPSLCGDGSVRVLVSRSHRDDRTDAWLARLPRRYTTLAAGSSLKFCRLAEGAADLYPRFGTTCPWDTAAGHCVLACAGGAVVDLGGKPLRYGSRHTDRNPDFLALGDPAWLRMLTP